MTTRVSKAEPDDVERLRARREQLLLRKLVRVYNSVNERTIRTLQERGHAELRPAFTALLGQLDSEGTRLGALARRMRVSRQAVSQLLVPIEAAGFVIRVPDPHDQRGVVVRFTPKGRRTLADAVEVIAGIDAELARALGDREVAKLKQLLDKVIAQVDPAGDFGLE